MNKTILVSLWFFVLSAAAHAGTAPEAAAGAASKEAGTKPVETAAQEKAVTPSAGKGSSAAETKVYVAEELTTFADKYADISQVDPYFFFMDPLDYQSKTVMLYARFDGMAAPGEAKFTIWRNFGKMHLVVSNVPKGKTIPDEKSVLMVGTITGFKKEVIGGELELIALLKLDGMYICNDARCKN